MTSSMVFVPSRSGQEQGVMNADMSDLLVRPTNLHASRGGHGT